MAKKLSMNQEIKLLRQLKNAKQLGCGSSRLVFIHPLDKTKVVKLAIGANAFVQNRNEVKLWETWKNDYLANIYEYGRFIIVMERIEDIYDEDSLFEEYDCIPNAAVDVINWLDNLLGESCDNYQIGYGNGRWALYDYGFSSYRDAQSQIGWANADVWDQPQIHDYINSCISLLRNKKPITMIENTRL